MCPVEHKHLKLRGISLLSILLIHYYLNNISILLFKFASHHIFARNPHPNAVFEVLRIKRSQLMALKGRHVHSAIVPDGNLSGIRPQLA